MYSNSSILALRAKGPFYHHHNQHCFSGDRAVERCGCCGPCCHVGTAHTPCAAAGFSARSILASPRFVCRYWLGQSALIRWVPTRIFISGGGGAAAVARYRRLTAAGDQDRCTDVEWGGWSKCGNRRVSGRFRVSDGSFQDMLGLLAEFEESCREDGSAAADGVVEESYLKEEVGFKSHRRICEKRRDSSREDDRVARGSEPSSSGRSASSLSSISGDSRSSKAFRRRHRDECSSSYGRQNDEITEKEVQEVRKHEDDSLSRRRHHVSDNVVASCSDTRNRESRTRDREDNTAPLMGSVLQSREKYVQKGQYSTGQKESKEELQKVSETSHVQQSSATGRHAVDKKMFNMRKEETSAVDLQEEIRRQRNELEQLRKDYQSLLRTTQVHSINVTKASASTSVSNTRVEDLGEASTLSMGLIEEIQRQRTEIEKLNENFQKLIGVYKIQERNIIGESNSTKSSRPMLESREESSTSAVNLVERGAVQYCSMDKQVIDDSTTASHKLTETSQLRQRHRTSDIHERDSRGNSNYKEGRSTVSGNRERKVISAINFVEEVQEHHGNIAQDQQNNRHTDLRMSSQKFAERADIKDQQSSRYTDLRISSQKFTERPDIRSNNTETTSRSQRHHVTKVGGLEERTSSSANFIKEREEQISNMDEQVSGHIDSRKTSQKLTDVVEVHKNDTTKASRSHDNAETIVKDQEDDSTSIQHLVKLKREKRVQIDQQGIEEINVNRDIQRHINISEAFSGEADNASSSFADHERNSVSAPNLPHEVQHPRNEAGKQVNQQLKGRIDFKHWSPESSEGGPVNISDSQMASSSGTNNGDDYSSLVLVRKAKEKDKTSLVEETSGTSSGTSESYYSTGQMQTHELDYNTKSDGFDPVKHDVLESARRLDECSSHYVGEFVDQLQQKVSASEEMDTTPYNTPGTLMEPSESSSLQKPKAAADYADEMHKQEGPWQYSTRSDVAGPSDDLWDVRGGSSQGPLPTEVHDKDSSSVRVLGTTSAPASTSGVIVKRSSKSLWSYIADIVRMGWRSHTTSQKSMLKSDARSSSNESVNSDAWHSHEQENYQEENVKNGQRVTRKEPELNKAAANKPHSRTDSALGQVASEVTGPGEKIMQVELDLSIPTETIGGSYGSDISASAPVLETFLPVHGGKGIEGIPFAVVTTSQSGLVGSTSVVSSEEETEIDRVHVSEVGLLTSEGEQKTEGISELVGIEGKDVELKRRKLQRNKQVLREEFEEWEEAYKLETEQRKTDELFMREALLEAKKAADMWEVPVGAVLVQDGKIIARGCNLVEDLRDSTAHAEMMCIREASSLLRTWRLAGTTLYVTLEPCAMCAGAILQARVDAVVWGAPNKLLGADGSWVRLFPGGDEGKQGLDQSHQMPGPVHPFHPKITIRRGVLSMECADAMQQFFQLRRKKKKPEPPPPACLPISYPARLLTKMHNIFGTMACM